jgi:cell division septation protein DedD
MTKSKAKGGVQGKKAKALLQLSHRRVAGWLGIFCFIYICIFLLGVIVGRGMAPGRLETDELQTELAELRASVLEEKQGFDERNTEELANNADFLFPAEVKKSGSSASGYRNKGAADAGIPHKTRAVRKYKKKDRAGRKAEGAARNKDAARLNKTVHFIQVASLKDRETADRFVAELKKKGYNAFHVKVRISSKEVRYRVRVGAFRDKAASYKVMKELKKEYKGALFVKQ